MLKLQYNSLVTVALEDKPFPEQLDVVVQMGY